VDISPESIADGVIRMLEDAELRERIATAGREIVTTHADFDRDADRLEAKYYELLTTARRRPPGYFERPKVIGEMVRYLVTRNRSLLRSACSKGEGGWLLRSGSWDSPAGPSLGRRPPRNFGRAST
jgi:hypothetical protein